MTTFEQSWGEVPGWRKCVGFIMWLSLIPSEAQIMRFIFGSGWDA